MGASFVFSGVSLGIVVPCMPMLVTALEMPPSQFGVVVSVVAISKLLGNIPAAYFIDVVGRKPVMVLGLVFCSLGLGGVGLCLQPGFGTPWLVGCRLLTGLGVSLYSAGAYMVMSDLSTAYNRTRTISPVMASFNAGLALGPAVGGLMMGTCGLSGTYFSVGAMFAALTLFNQSALSETRPLNTSSPLPINSKLDLVLGIWRGYGETYRSWTNLLSRSDPALRDISILALTASLATAGAQMTMLPLLLIGPTFGMTVYGVGATFTFTSIVSVLGR